MPGRFMALFDHRLGSGLRGKEDACHIGVLEALELFQRHVQHRSDRDDAGVADRDVDPTQLRGHLIQHAGHLLVLAHIAADGHDLAT